MLAKLMTNQNITIKRSGGVIFVTIFIMWMMVASDTRPSSAAPPGQTVPDGYAYLPLVFRPCPEARELRTPNLLGVQMYGDTSTTSPYFQHMVDSKASWVRVEVSWRRAEPINVEPDQFNWDFADSALAASAQGGINIIGTINYNPPWAAGRPLGPISSENLADFGQFVTALVERYDGDGIDDEPCGRVVKHWEFYNEPDGRWHWGNDGDKYADMLSVAYPAVKAASPEAQVLLGGLAYDWFEDQGGSFVRHFLTDVLEAGGGDYFDIMNFHAYPAFAGNWTQIGPGLAEKSAAIRSVLTDYGLDKPQMVTETGSHSNDASNAPSTPEMQASYVVELYTQAKAADIDALIWFMLYDLPEWSPYDHGLVTRYPVITRKLAFSTFQQSAELLGNTSFDRILTDEELGDPDMFAYRFITPNTGTALYVVWMNPADTDETAEFSVPGTLATVYDIFAASYAIFDIDDGDQDNELTVTVGSQPLVIEIKQ